MPGGTPEERMISLRAPGSRDPDTTSSDMARNDASMRSVRASSVRRRTSASVWEKSYAWRERAFAGHILLYNDIRNRMECRVLTT